MSTCNLARMQTILTKARYYTGMNCAVSPLSYSLVPPVTYPTEHQVDDDKISSEVTLRPVPDELV